MGMFSQPTGNRTYTRGDIALRADGSMMVPLVVANDAGKTVDRFQVIVPVAGAVVDQDGNQLAASVPAGISNARTSLLNAIDTAIDNAAAAGKFAR